MNSRPEVDENDRPGVGAELVTSDGRALPLVSATLRAEAGGGLARVVLEQTFENLHQETLHVTYKMPLPADGAVSGYEFTIGHRTIKGRVEPKAVAREQFEQAIAEGRTAALLEQQRADIFTQELGNIPPGETIVARITVDQRLAWLTEGEWELRFPTVIGPRYIGSCSEHTDDDARAVQVKVAPEEDVRARIHLEVVVNDELVTGRKVTSPSHALAPMSVPMTAARGKHMQLQAHEGARLDRDIVVRWPVARPEVGVSVAVARPNGSQAHAHLAYGLVTIVPPSPEANFLMVPRDLIVLIDTSGSMGGGPLDQAKKVVSLLIESLGVHDRLELVEFSSRPSAWQKSPVNVTSETKKKAIAWVKSLNAGGATEMYTAIVESLKAIRPGAQRQVVLVTDGYIGGEQQVVELLHERLPADCRMHVVGVGSGVNRSLATAISRAGRGAEVLVGLDEDPEKGARRLLDRTADPVLTDVTIEGAAVVEVAPEHVPDVFAGSPVVAAVKLSNEGGEVIVRGKHARGTWEQTVRVPAMAQGEGNQAIVSLFGREHVADLEMRWTIGREAEMINRTIERIGTVFQIATRMTSWVAVDDIVRTVDPSSGSRRVVQPQQLPYGTTIEGFGLGGGPQDLGSVGMTQTRAGTMPRGGMREIHRLHDQLQGKGTPTIYAGGAPVPPASARASAGMGAPPPPQQQIRSSSPGPTPTPMPERSMSLGSAAAPSEAKPAPQSEHVAYSVSSSSGPARMKRRPSMLLVVFMTLSIVLVILGLAWFLYSLFFR